MASWRDLMARRKVVDNGPSQLVRRLGAFDLVMLGVGATLGGGAYVLGPVVAHNTGSSVLLSFAISGFASVLSAL